MTNLETIADQVVEETGVSLATMRSSTRRPLVVEARRLVLERAIKQQAKVPDIAQFMCKGRYWAYSSLRRSVHPERAEKFILSTFQRLPYDDKRRIAVRLIKEFNDESARRKAAEVAQADVRTGSSEA